jgi:hypothetical protein
MRIFFNEDRVLSVTYYEPTKLQVGFDFKVGTVEFQGEKLRHTKGFRRLFDITPQNTPLRVDPDGFHIEWPFQVTILPEDEDGDPQHIELVLRRNVGHGLSYDVKILLDQQTLILDLPQEYAVEHPKVLPRLVKR